MPVARCLGQQNLRVTQPNGKSKLRCVGSDDADDVIVS